jgi:hypothetical protein
VGGGWAQEIETFLGPVKWHRADRRVPFGAQKAGYCKRNNHGPAGMVVKGVVTSLRPQPPLSIQQASGAQSKELVRGPPEIVQHFRL